MDYVGPPDDPHHHRESFISLLLFLFGGEGDVMSVMPCSFSSSSSSSSSFSSFDVAGPGVLCVKEGLKKTAGVSWEEYREIRGNDLLTLRHEFSSRSI